MDIDGKRLLNFNFQINKQYQTLLKKIKLFYIYLSKNI